MSAERNSFSLCTFSISILTFLFLIGNTHHPQRLHGGTISSSTQVSMVVPSIFISNEYAVCCAAARAFNIVLWERLKEFARFEMERLPRDKNIDVRSGHTGQSDQRRLCKVI